MLDAYIKQDNFQDNKTGEPNGSNNTIELLRGIVESVLSKKSPNLEYVYHNFNNLSDPLDYFQKALIYYKHEINFGFTYIKISSEDQQIPNRDYEIIEAIIQSLEAKLTGNRLSTMYEIVGDFFTDIGLSAFGINYYVKSLKINEKTETKIKLAKGMIETGDYKNAINTLNESSKNADPVQLEYINELIKLYKSIIYGGAL